MFVFAMMTGMLILPLLNLEGQMEIDLTNLGISFVNMTTSSADELRRALESTQPPEIILTNVEGVGDKAKRDVDNELAWLLPILASDERIKCQIFVLDKMTEDLIGEQ